MRLTPEDTVCDPACGTVGFLLAAHERVLEEHGHSLDLDQKRHLQGDFAPGFELVPNTGRLCVMNHYLHGLDDAKVTSGQDSLAQDPGERYSMVLTNPPFGKKSSVSIANDLRPDR
jgi:type I restriction enzyme M protein